MVCWLDDDYIAAQISAGSLLFKRYRLKDQWNKAAVRIEHYKAAACTDVLEAEEENQEALALAGLSQDHQVFGTFQLWQEILEFCNAAISDDLPKNQPTGKPALEQARQPVPEVRDDVFEKLHRFKGNYESEFFDKASMGRQEDLLTGHLIKFL